MTWALGIALGFGPYFSICPSSRPNTDTVLFVSVLFIKIIHTLLLLVFAWHVFSSIPYYSTLSQTVTPCTNMKVWVVQQTCSPAIILAQDSVAGLTDRKTGFSQTNMRISGLSNCLTIGGRKLSRMHFIWMEGGWKYLWQCHPLKL